MTMKEVRLNNGVIMPAIGFGVFQIPENETERVVTDALEAGYRMIDTAAAYFNERQGGGNAKICSLPPNYGCRTMNMKTPFGPLTTQ